MDIGAGWESVVPSWDFESFSWGISSLWTPMGVLWPTILLCLVLGLYWVYLRLLPCVHGTQWECVKRPMGRLTSLPFWSPGSLSAYTVRKISLTSRMRKAWTLLSGQGSALPPLHLGASVDRGQTPGLSIGPICVLRQLGKSLNFSEPQFPFLYNGVIIIHLRVEARALSKLQTTGSAVHQNHCGTLKIYRCPVPASRNVDYLGLFCCPRYATYAICDFIAYVKWKNLCTSPKIDDIFIIW